VQKGNRMRHVLVVDDEPAICELMQLALEADGMCRVVCAPGAAEAAAALQQQRFDAAVVDAVLRQASGVLLAIQLLALGVPVLLVTGEPAMQAKLDDIGCPYLAKPFPLNVLVSETNMLLDETAQRRGQLALLLPNLVVTTVPTRTGE
jgi:DNA-binding response OmpR family regulator